MYIILFNKIVFVVVVVVVVVDYFLQFSSFDLVSVVILSLSGVLNQTTQR